MLDFRLLQVEKEEENEDVAPFEEDDIDPDGKEFDECEEEIEKMYDVEGVHQEYIAQPTLENEEVDIHNFEDEFYRMSDKIAHDYINDNINDTLHLANSNNTHEDVTNMDSEAFKSFYHKVKNVDINDVTPEEREQLSIIREELKPEQVESKRHTWFNFMREIWIRTAATRSFLRSNSICSDETPAKCTSTKRTICF